jgi:hypothetical protein
MTTEPQREINLADMIMAIFRWLTLVAAIALGVCLGIYLFFRLVGAEMQQDMKTVWTPPTFSTPTYAP